MIRKESLVFLLALNFLSSVIAAQNLMLPQFAERISWPEKKKEQITKFAEKNLTKSLTVFHEGQRVYEYGDTDRPYEIFSARKSILSLLFGIYIDRGIIDPEATLADLGIKDLQGLSKYENQARIIDLLRSRSGVYHPAAYETPGMEKNRPKRGMYKPGEHWFYNNWDFNTLTTIFEQQTGTKVFESFHDDMGKPLGLTDFEIDLQKYHYENASMHPATSWYFSANQLDRIGQLLLNHGNWNGNQIIPTKWIAESTSPYSDLGILGGYGYCWWAALNGMHYPFVNIPDGSFSARGTGEQTILVIPPWQMVIVHLTEVTSPDDDMMHVTDFGRLLAIILEQ